VLVIKPTPAHYTPTGVMCFGALVVQCVVHCSLSCVQHVGALATWQLSWTNMSTCSRLTTDLICTRRRREDWVNLRTTVWACMCANVRIRRHIKTLYESLVIGYVRSGEAYRLCIERWTRQSNAVQCMHVYSW